MRWVYHDFSYLDPEPRTLLAELNQKMGPRYAKLNKALIEMVCKMVLIKCVDHKTSVYLIFMIAFLDVVWLLSGGRIWDGEFYTP